MEKNLKTGDLVKSIAGRDKENVFLVVSVDGKFVYVTDGKIHTIKRQKRKNAKHLEKVSTANLTSFVERIQKGEAVSNKKVHSAIKAHE